MRIQAFFFRKYCAWLSTKWLDERPPTPTRQIVYHSLLSLTKWLDHKASLPLRTLTLRSFHPPLVKTPSYTKQKSINCHRRQGSSYCCAPTRARKLFGWCHRFESFDGRSLYRAVCFTALADGRSNIPYHAQPLDRMAAWGQSFGGWRHWSLTAPNGIGSE
jgi:hypothetical protein